MAVTIDGVGEINGVVLPTTSFGKILQVVRATDSTSRSTTSTSYVDVTGMSVTITPQKSTSSIIIMAIGGFRAYLSADTDNYGVMQITDPSNTTISGAHQVHFGLRNITGTGAREIRVPLNMVAYDSPASVSAQTYKLRWYVPISSTTIVLRNDLQTGQMFAIEVSA